MMLLLNEGLFFYCFDKDLYFFCFVDKNRDKIVWSMVDIRVIFFGYLWFDVIIDISKRIIRNEYWNMRWLNIDKIILIG